MSTGQGVLRNYFMEALDEVFELASSEQLGSVDAIAGTVRNLLERVLASLAESKTLCTVNVGVLDVSNTVERIGGLERRNEYYTLFVACKVGDYFVKARMHVTIPFIHDVARGRRYYGRIELDSLEDMAIERWSNEHLKWLSREPDEEYKKLVRERRALMTSS